MESSKKSGAGRSGQGSFGGRLRSLRLSREMSQLELAQRIGRHQTAIGPYERDEYAPPRDIVERLAEVLGTTPEYLAFGRRDGRAGVPLLGRIGPGGLLTRQEGDPGVQPLRLAAERFAGVAIDDDGMAPVLRIGQLALVPGGPDREPWPLLGRDVLATLADGRTILRRLLPASDPELFDLGAYAAPTLRAVRVAGARPVLGVLWTAALGGGDTPAS
ncbi:MAG TPA: helix-turn-helix transcriptional regulator [Geminicoccaceae bacterium]|nr:helix-turn-helix transcriptional regulator [Geminicoccus sp.]HMU49152.1 helix-turn-helix transcriptional regulator [Geminicoccaceae bacterium]